MSPRPSRRTLLIASGLFAGLAAPAWAGGTGTAGCTTCSTPPPPCDCIVSSSHEVRVPGIAITPPSVVINAPPGAFINAGVGSASSSAGAESSAESSAGSSSSVSVSVNGSSSASGAASANALVNASNFINGGGGGFSETGGVTTDIENIKVEQPTVTQRVCAETQNVAKVFSVEATCLDDKAVPHPASQVLPDHEIAQDFEGEVYRCIAGARMQYTLQAVGAGAGRTIACQKGEALYHSAGGALQCRPQKPARDCNERSLLRRYGAGIKLVKVVEAGVCVAWRNETVQASQQTQPGQPIVLNGGSWR